MCTFCTCLFRQGIISFLRENALQPSALPCLAVLGVLGGRWPIAVWARTIAAIRSQVTNDSLFKELRIRFHSQVDCQGRRRGKKLEKHQLAC